MSNEDAELTLNEHLEAIRDRYRRRDRLQRLEAIAEDLYQLLLERVVAETLLDIEIPTNSDLQSRIRSILNHVQDEDIDAITNSIEALEEEVEAYRSEVESNRARPQAAFLDRLSSMIELNKQLEVVEQAELTDLYKLMESGNWLHEIETEGFDAVGDDLEKARIFGREKRSIYEAAEKEVFEPYLEGEFGDVVHRILDSDSVTVADISETEFKELSESDLARYVRLRLG